MPARRQSAAAAESRASGDSAKSRASNSKEKESFGCPYPGCGQSYSRMEYLKRHQRKHQDDRPFVCKDCAKAFARSDVLLRHRRRCHPTPPPDRNSHSPPQLHRGYPGIQVSDSRTDSRDPSYRSRKHARESSPGSRDDAQAGSATRRRLDDEDDDEDDERYGETSRYGAANNGINGGGMYYQQSLNNDSTYTPHLLPMFQQTPTFASNGDPNNLEDASVLLSMAYGSSSSTQENHPTVQGQRVVADDWAPSPTINMMLEAGSNGQNGQAGANNSKSNSLPSNLSGANVTLGNVNNFLAGMNWLGKDGLAGPGGTNNWFNNANAGALTTLPRPASPFGFSNLFSSPNFGMAQLQGDGQADEDETSRAVMSILDQLSQYDIPQSKANPNPERPILRVDHESLWDRAGLEMHDKNSRFYLPAERFAGCYQVPHWGLPPLRTLSIMASRTFHTVLGHFSMVHLPTFRLIDTAACLAFAICTVGGMKSSKPKWAAILKGQSSRFNWPDSPLDEIDGPLPPGQGWQSIYATNYARGGFDDADMKRVEEWGTADVVRNEKSGMLVKSFSLAKGVLMTEYNVALLQALILYNAPFFLSEDETERALANMFLGTIVNITRQVGFFAQELEHFEIEIQAPPEPWTRNELDLYWRRWIQLETRRRTAFLVYHLDSVSALESNINCLLSPTELCNMPLPAPDSVWRAETAEDWFNALKTFKPMTLDEAMRRVFFLPTFGSFDTLHEKADTKFYTLLNTTELGPFARTAMISTLLRGIIDIGEGKRDRGDWRDLTDLWVGCTWLRPGTKMLDSNGEDIGKVTREGLRGRFTCGIQKWREGWDFDPTCPSPGSSSSSPMAASSGLDSTLSPASLKSPSPESAKLNYCEEALPLYWLSLALMNVLQSAPPHEPGWNVFQNEGKYGLKGLKYGDMLKTARKFARTGEGLAHPSSTMTGSLSAPGESTAAASASASASTEGETGEGGENAPSTGSAGMGLGDEMGLDIDGFDVSSFEGILAN